MSNKIKQFVAFGVASVVALVLCIGVLVITVNNLGDNTNTTEQIIVVTKSDFSSPRLVVYSSPELPNPAPSDAPRCCNNIKIMVRIAEIKVTTSRKLPNCIK